MMWVVRYRIRKFDNLLLTIKFKTGFIFASKWQEPRFETDTITASRNVNYNDIRLSAKRRLNFRPNQPSKAVAL